MDAAALLGRVDLFAGAPTEVIERLASRCDRRSYPAGAAMVREGGAGDSLYVIAEGEARVVVGGRPRRDLGAGTFFGEISVLDDQSRSASVYAVSDVEALVLPAEMLREEIEASDALQAAVILGLCARLRTLERDRWAEAEESRLRELQRLFIQNIGHELRTPLTVALSAVQLTDRLMDKPDKLQIVLSRAREQLQHLHGLIEDVLDIAAARNEDIELDLVPEPIGQLIEAAIVASDIPADRVMVSGEQHVIVLVDGPRVRRVLTALLGNADKFGPEGGRVDVVVATSDDLVTVDVSDDGEGIPPEQQNAVFDPFNQVDPTSTRAKGGMGIGLPLARSAARLHGGDLVYVEGAARTTFRLALPRRDGDQLTDSSAS